MTKGIKVAPKVSIKSAVSSGQMESAIKVPKGKKVTLQRRSKV
jgi:hypothetical protein